jgi:alpha-L-fucosidase
MTRLSLLCGVLLVATGARAAEPPAAAPSPANLEARQRFRDAKFGMFVHWGIYSVLADGEWVMQVRKIRASDYETLAERFDPVRFDAARWVALAKAAGMRYITITAKHHDGFAMFDSKASDYDVVARTPYAKDPLKRLADECHEQGLQIFFYYSQLDWHNPDYYPRGETGQYAGRPDHGDWSRYLDYMDAQLSELLTGYGPVGGIWFDGFWDKKDADWRLARTYALIHRLQPQALIGSNHHQAPHPGEDFQMFEKDLPGENRAGFSGEAKVSALPLETAETMNDSWGFTLTDHAYKSVPELIRYLVRAAGHDANLLLNVGPTALGEIPEEAQERLRAVGSWLSSHGASIYGTRGGPLSPRPWGVTTRKGDTVYVHVLDWPDEALALPPLGRRVARAQALVSAAPVPFSETAAGVVLRIPAAAREDVDTVLALTLAAK